MPKLNLISELIQNFRLPFEAHAVDLEPSALDLPASFTDLGTVVSAGLPLVITSTGLLMFGYLLYGGLRYVMASGDSKQIQEAVKTLTNAIIGLAIVFASFWIVRIIETVFGLKITNLAS